MLGLGHLPYVAGKQHKRHFLLFLRLHIASKTRVRFTGALIENEQLSWGAF